MARKANLAVGPAVFIEGESSMGPIPDDIKAIMKDIAFRCSGYGSMSRSFAAFVIDHQFTMEGTERLVNKLYETASKSSWFPHYAVWFISRWILSLDLAFYFLSARIYVRCFKYCYRWVFGFPVFHNVGFMTSSVAIWIGADMLLQSHELLQDPRWRLFACYYFCWSKEMEITASIISATIPDALAFLFICVLSAVLSAIS
jgi:hypothetical protein